MSVPVSAAGQLRRVRIVITSQLGSFLSSGSHRRRPFVVEGVALRRFPFIIGLCIAWQIIGGGGDGSGGWSVKDSRTYRLLVIETCQTFVCSLTSGKYSASITLSNSWRAKLSFRDSWSTG